MILIQGFIKVASENVAALRLAAARLAAATRQETGAIAYAFAEDVSEPGLFHIIERWADEAALAAHNKTPHLAAFMAAMPSLGVQGVRVARYEASGEVVLVGA